MNDKRDYRAPGEMQRGIRVIGDFAEVMRECNFGTSGTSVAIKLSSSISQSFRSGLRIVSLPKLSIIEGWAVAHQGRSIFLR
jgi:hypothetical protein